MFTLLKTLMTTPSVSGREENIRKTLEKYIAPLCDEVSTDALGNLIALKKGSAENPKKVMLCAHMDEIGFLVTFIEEEGFIRIAPVGGIHATAVAYTEVVSEKDGVKLEKLIYEKHTDCFVINRITLSGGEHRINIEDSYGVYIVTKGSGELIGEGYSRGIKKGDYFFMPACEMGKFSLKGDNLEVVECW